MAGGSCVFATCNAELRTPLCCRIPCFHCASVRTAAVRSETSVLCLCCALSPQEWPGVRGQRTCPSSLQSCAGVWQLAPLRRVSGAPEVHPGACLWHATPFDFNSLLAPWQFQRLLSLWSCSSPCSADAWEPRLAHPGLHGSARATPAPTVRERDATGAHPDNRPGPSTWVSTCLPLVIPYTPDPTPPPLCMQLTSLTRLQSYPTAARALRAMTCSPLIGCPAF